MTEFFRVEVHKLKGMYRKRGCKESVDVFRRKDEVF